MDTTTTTETNVAVITETQHNNTKEISVEAPLFLLFAEYLGYVSIFNKVAENWCDGKVPDIHVQRIIILEAKCILRQMKKDYSIDDIRDYYEMYYPYIFKDYAEALAKLIEK